MNNEQERNSNFELLRLISIFFIVLYHVILHGNVLSNNTNEGLAVIIILVKFLTLVHVNSYIILMGYFQSKGKFKQSKLWSLINSSLFYKAIIIVILSMLGVISLTRLDVLKELFVLNLSEYWFIKLYVFLYCISPFLNKLIQNMDKNDYRKLLIVLTIIISVLPYITGGQAFDNNGYTLYNFIYLYFIGGYLREYPIEKSYLLKKCSKSAIQLILLVTIIGCVFANFCIFKTSEALLGTNDIIDEISRNLINMTEMYSNPILIVQTVAFFAFFSTLSLKSKVINNLAKLTLGVYLIHDNNFIRPYLYKVTKIDNGPITSSKMIIYIFGVAITINIVCFTIEWLRQLLFKFISKRKLSIKVRTAYYNWLNSLYISKETNT